MSEAYYILMHALKNATHIIIDDETAHKITTARKYYATCVYVCIVDDDTGEDIIVFDDTTTITINNNYVSLFDKQDDSLMKFQLVSLIKMEDA